MYAVIDHLDMMKKDSAGAREAIRWLETEFHKGNRSVQSLFNVADIYFINMLHQMCEMRIIAIDDPGVCQWLHVASLCKRGRTNLQ